MPTKTHTVQSTRLGESISSLENRLLELQIKYDARHADLKVAEALCLKNLEEAANKQTANAVDRIVKLVEFARNLLLALIVIAAVLGVGGYLQIQSSIKEFATTQVKSWLNIAEPTSPLHGPISRLTTRVAVDALIMDRARFGTRSGFLGNMKISRMWIDKMLQDLMSPATSEGDYADLALALSSEAALIGGGEHRLLIVDTVRKILLDPEFPVDRKATLFRTFGFDPSLNEVAVNLFQNGKNIDIQAAAFRFLRKSIASERLADLARPIVATTPANAHEDFLLLQHQAAETLADANPSDKELSKYLASKNQKDAYIERALIGLAAVDKISTDSAASPFQIAESEKRNRIAFAAPLVAAAIDAGATVAWSENAAGIPIVALQRTQASGKVYHTISTPRALLTPSLADAIMNKLGRHTAGLSKLVRAVSGVDDFKEELGRPYRVQLSLGAADTVITTSGDILTKNRVDHPLYLESDTSPGTPVMLRWRDLDGLYKTTYLREAKLTDSSVKIVPASAGSDRYLNNYSYNSRYD